MKKILLVVSLVSVLLLAGCNKEKEVNNNVNDNVPEVVIDNQEADDVKEKMNDNNEYVMYEEFKWYFKEYGEKTGLVSIDENGDVYMPALEKSTLENGNDIFENNGSIVKVTSIDEKAKLFVTTTSQTLDAVYVLTYNGNVFKCDAIKPENAIDDNFKKISFDKKIVDMTIYYNIPYYLLEDGRLLNADGKEFKEIYGNYDKALDDYCIGNIFIDNDGLAFVRGYDDEKFEKLKDINNKQITIENIYNSMSENGNAMLFIITKDNVLISFCDGDLVKASVASFKLENDGRQLIVNWNDDDTVHFISKGEIKYAISGVEVATIPNI